MFARIKNAFVAMWYYLIDTDLLPGKSNTLMQAERAARVLLNQGVSRVQLFGSVARCGAGDDIDLVVTVDASLATRFIRNARAMNEHDGYVGAASYRYDLALDLLADTVDWGWDDERIHLEENLLAATRGMTLREFYGIKSLRHRRIQERCRKIDIFLLAEGWETDDALRWDYPMQDPNFFDNIAKEAKEFDPATGRFNGVSHLRGSIAKYRKNVELRRLHWRIKWRITDRTAPYRVRLAGRFPRFRRQLLGY